MRAKNENNYSNDSDEFTVSLLSFIMMPFHYSLECNTNIYIYSYKQYFYCTVHVYLCYILCKIY